MTVRRILRAFPLVCLMTLMMLASSCSKPRGCGAEVPFTTHEAEKGLLSGGAAVGTDADTLQASSGKAYVLLPKGGSAEFTLTAEATAATLRYGLPKESAGRLVLLLDGREEAACDLDAKQCWSIPDTGAPDSGVRRYDEASVVFSKPAGEGTRLTVRNDGDAPVALDLVDTERVSGKPSDRPEGSLSVIDYGATPDDDSDDTEAIARCLADAAAGKRTVFFPVGRYVQSKRLSVPEGVALRGAGMWFTEISFVTPGATFDDHMGYALTAHNTISGLRFVDKASFSRNNAGILLRPFGSDQKVEDCWFKNIGCVFGWDEGEVSRTVFRDNRVIGTYFDGIHWGDGRYTDNLATNNYFRGLGDDAVAQVNRDDMGLAENNKASFNTVVASWWGRGITDIGGKNMTVTDNLIDSCYLAGVMIATEELGEAVSRPVDGLVLERNTIRNCGHAGHNHASLHIYLANNPMRGVIIRSNLIELAATDGIRIDATAFGDKEVPTVIEGNTFKNIAGKPYVNENGLVKPIKRGNAGLP